MTFSLSALEGLGTRLPWNILGKHRIPHKSHSMSCDRDYHGIGHVGYGLLASNMAAINEPLYCTILQESLPTLRNVPGCKHVWRGHKNMHVPISSQLDVASKQALGARYCCVSLPSFHSLSLTRSSLPPSLGAPSHAVA